MPALVNPSTLIIEHRWRPDVREMYSGVFYQDTRRLLVKELGATVQSVKEDYWPSEMVSVSALLPLCHPPSALQGCSSVRAMVSKLLPHLTHD